MLMLPPSRSACLTLFCHAINNRIVKQSLRNHRWIFKKKRKQKRKNGKNRNTAMVKNTLSEDDDDDRDDPPLDEHEHFALHHRAHSSENQDVSACISDASDAAGSRNVSETTCKLDVG